MIETQLSICTWADDTFGPPVSDASIAARALQEMAELVTACVAGAPAEVIGVEIADVVIVLARLGRSCGVDVVAVTSDTYRLRSTGVPSWLAAHAMELLARMLRLLVSEDALLAFADRDLLDIVRVLAQLALRVKADLPAAIDAKMAINRARKWKLDGRGHGQHAREG